MFQDSFISVEHGAAAALLDILNPHVDGAPFDSASARILKHPLPFYADHILVEVSDYDVNPPRRLSFICKDVGKPEKIYILDGRNEVVYQLNESVPLALNDENYALYVRFFFHYVQGRHGRFLIVQSVDDIDWREEPAPAGRKALGKMIKPITLKEKTPDGGYQLGVNIVFKDSLFESNIGVDLKGMVTMSNQELLVEDIPVLDDQFGQ